jgi:hypothetical protein
VGHFACSGVIGRCRYRKAGLNAADEQVTARTHRRTAEVAAVHGFASHAGAAFALTLADDEWGTATSRLARTVGVVDGVALLLLPPVHGEQLRGVVNKLVLLLLGCIITHVVFGPSRASLFSREARVRNSVGHG